MDYCCQGLRRRCSGLLTPSSSKLGPPPSYSLPPSGRWHRAHIPHAAGTTEQKLAEYDFELPRRTVSSSSGTACSAPGIPSADVSGLRAPMVWRPSWPVRLRPSHHIGASAEQAAPPRTGTWKWSERSPRGRPPSAHPRGGWRRAGRCSQLLSDAKTPQHPKEGP
jgi:hypothetical protein